MATISYIDQIQLSVAGPILTISPKLFNNVLYLFAASNGGITVCNFDGNSLSLLLQQPPLSPSQTVLSVDAFQFAGSGKIYVVAGYLSKFEIWHCDPTLQFGGAYFTLKQTVSIGAFGVCATNQGDIFISGSISNPPARYIFNEFSEQIALVATAATVASYPRDIVYFPSIDMVAVTGVNLYDGQMNLVDSDNLGYCTIISSMYGEDNLLFARFQGFPDRHAIYSVADDELTRLDVLYDGGSSGGLGDKYGIAATNNPIRVYCYGYQGLEEAYAKTINETEFGSNVIVENPPLKDNAGEMAAYENYLFFSSGDGTSLMAYEFVSSPEEYSSSTSSQSSSSSSSSSIDGPESRELWSVLIKQEHHNLLPFSFVAEGGISDSNTLTFELETTQSPYFDYSLLLGRSSASGNTYESTTHVPVDKEGGIEHNNVFHVEIFAKDISGIRDYNVNMQNEVYGFESPNYVFNAPKFSWRTSAFVSSGSSEDAQAAGVWVGNAQNGLYRIGYDSDSAIITYANSIASEPHTILFEKDKSRTYITAYDHLMNVSIDDYGTASNVNSEITENVSILNYDNDVAVLTEPNAVWTMQAYSGNIVQRSPDTLSIMASYGGFDAPRSMIWSEYHQAYFVAGTNILWRFKNGVKKAIYEIKGYEIAEVAVSPSGYVCLIFDGENNDIIRILKPDLFGIAMSETITEGIARHCTYCDQGIFYILVELSGASYRFSSYLYNSQKGTLEVIEDSAELATTTTTTTPAAPDGKVEIDYPNGGEWLNIGDTIEIAWRSLESATDNVKIELYKGGSFYKTIKLQTPNTGVYEWMIPADTPNGTDYAIKITWLAATDLPENYDFSDANFTISNIVSTTTTTTTTTTPTSSIGIGFNPGMRHVVNVLKNGWVGFFDLDEKLFYGLFDSSLLDITCMAVRDDTLQNFSNVSAVRIFVGSEEHLSDKWDSGVVETTKTSMYYGGGNNLTPGDTYYVNIQVYDVSHGWSNVQTKEWTMPR